MNAMSRVSLTNDNAPAATRASTHSMGLGPNQLQWLRRNMDAFRHLEEQRYSVHQDALRAARRAGLA